MKRSFFGFTLAEVLITLGIIGVVAAMTIPTLIANYQKTQYVIQLKKNYTQFNQALKILSLDNGCPDDLKCTGLFASTTNNVTLGDELVKYFKIIKNCKADVGQQCAPSNVCDLYDGSDSRYNFNGEGNYNFITTDGTYIGVSNFQDNCTSNYSSGMTGNLSQTCGNVFFDLNGPNKGPNNFGRDLFVFMMSNGKGAIIYPSGGIDDDNNGWWNESGNKMCTEDEDKDGMYCAARIMEEGWQMDY